MSQLGKVAVLVTVIVLVATFTGRADAAEPLAPGEYTVVLSGELHVSFTVDANGQPHLTLAPSGVEVVFSFEDGRVLDEFEVRTADGSYEVEVTVTDRGSYNVEVRGEDDADEPADDLVAPQPDAELTVEPADETAPGRQDATTPAADHRQDGDTPAAEHRRDDDAPAGPPEGSGTPGTEDDAGAPEQRETPTKPKPDATNGPTPDDGTEDDGDEATEGDAGTDDGAGAGSDDDAGTDAGRPGGPADAQDGADDDLSSSGTDVGQPAEGAGVGARG